MSQIGWICSAILRSKQLLGYCLTNRGTIKVWSTALRGSTSYDLDRLIVGPGGGVANAVVFVKNISSGNNTLVKFSISAN